MYLSVVLALLPFCAHLAAAACISDGDQTAINNAFSTGGAGTVVQICQNALIVISDTIMFTADDQEISTEGYPTGSSRATIRIGPSNNCSTLVKGSWFNGVKVRNIQLDGDLANNGHMAVNGNANIEFGGGAYNQVIDHVNSTNPRGFSSCHYIDSGTNPVICTNGTVTNSQFGPSGSAGTDGDGNGLWADGISYGCTEGVVANNTVFGATDGGIVIYGAPGTVVYNNTITSSPTNKQYSAFNLVDNVYPNGTFANVLVYNNTIIGDQLIAVGFSMGSCLTDHCTEWLTGPVVVTNNTISGNVTFAVALAGFTGGVTVTDIDVSGLTNPATSFADFDVCSAPVAQFAQENERLIAALGQVSGPLTLQSGFADVSGAPTDFICPVPPLPTSISFNAGNMTAPVNTYVAELHGGIGLFFQGDGNLNMLGTVDGSSNSLWASGSSVNCGTSGCEIEFTSSGTLESTLNGVAQWSSASGGSGAVLVVSTTDPYLQIKDSAGNVVWTENGSVAVGSTTTTTSSPPMATTTTASAPATSSATSGETTVPQWSQCGGEGYTGSTVCAAPYTCVAEGAWWSSCQ